MAPDATLLNGKVLDDTGYGTESGVIAGMEWATAQGAKVVNLSLGAPGTEIVAARAAGTEPGEPVGEHYTTMSGTSMATPHVAGTAALLAQRNPDWTGEQLRSHLMATANPEPGSRATDQGAGRVDADQATAATITVDADELEYGFVKWPHPDPEPVSKELTYRNTGTTAVTLELQTQPDPDSVPVRLSATRLIVPAGGQATVEVTAEFGTKVGDQSGRVIAATDGGDPLVTHYGWHLEPEMYDLTITGTKTDGSPAASSVAVGRRGNEFYDLVMLAAGRVKLRVPPRSYAASGTFVTEATDTAPDTVALVSEPNFTVTGDRTVTLDARKARAAPVEVAGKPWLRTHEVGISMQLGDSSGRSVGSVGFAAAGESWRLVATPTAAVPETDQLDLAIGGRLQVPPYRARTASGADLAVSYIPFAPRFTGEKKLMPVDASTAAPEDLAADRVTGKLAVVRRQAGLEAQQALAVEKAGAAAVLFFDPDRPGLLRTGGRSRFSGPTLPVLATDRITARRVLTQTKPVRITGVAFSPFVYETIGTWSDRIPADPSVRKRQADFATVQEEFHAPGEHAVLEEYRSGRRAGTGAALGGFWAQPVRPPARRTSYLTGSLVWMDSAFTQGRFATDSTDWRLGERELRPGQQASQRWFAPVMNSGLPRRLPPGGIGAADLIGLSYVGRDGEHYNGLLTVAIAPFTSGAANTHEWPYTLNGSVGQYEIVVRRNGQEIGRADQPASWHFDVPEDAADYQITMDVQRELPWWQYSTRAKSNWWFRSKGGHQELMPMIVAEVDVPEADLRNQVKVGRPTQIDLVLRHQERSGPPPITSAKLEVSYDGKTWADVPLRPGTGSSYSATVTHPAAQAGNAVHLCRTATDAAGGRLTQEVTRAYGLKK